MPVARWVGRRRAIHETDDVKGCVQGSVGGAIMDERDVLASVLAALHAATLDDTLWPSASALIDDACGIGTSGSALVVGEGEGDDARIWFAEAYAHGERRQDLVREYFEVYYPHDERVPRIRRLPDSQLVHIPDLYTARELKTSQTYNEGLRRTGGQNGLNVRLDGPHGSRIVWAISNPIATSGWGSTQIELIESLLPHIRQFVRIRQAMASAQALGASLSGLLDNTRVAVIHLDRRGRVVEANARALDLLRCGEGLSDAGGFLGAWLPADNAKFQSLLARALPPFGSQRQAASGSMTIRRSAALPRFVLHINPVHGGGLDFGARGVAALVLVVDPASRPKFDAELVAEVLGLTAAESQVAIMLSDGRTTHDIAMTTGRQISTVYTLVRRAYRKLGISRQADLVRLMLSLADVSSFRR